MTAVPEDTLLTVRSMIAARLNIESPDDDEDLIGSGVLDSLALVELLLAIEQRFRLAVELDALEIDDFRTPTSLAAFVERQRAAQPR